MQKLIKFDFVPANQIIVSMDGTRLVDVHKTIATSLNKIELAAYSRSIKKVCSGQKLNADDAKLLDKIDEITFSQHGLCLKDSKITKARIKACKRYGVSFKDRDGLEDHMNSMRATNLQIQAEQDTVLSVSTMNKLNMEIPTGYREAISKVENGIALDKEDLQEIQGLAKFARDAMGWQIVHQATRAAVKEACKRLGIKTSTILLDEQEFMPLH